MRWFLDTEFNEDGRTIELISIALVNEPGTYRYHAVSSEFDPARCNEFVCEHVLPHLPDGRRGTRAEIADDIHKLVLKVSYDLPEFWAYYADYDWVVLCQLYGRMVDLPEGFPFFCHDLQQLIDGSGFEATDLPKQCGPEHEALADAEWVRTGFIFLRDQLRNQSNSP